MQIINSKLNYKSLPMSGHIHLFTANQVIKSNGRLVMGAGNAKACLDAHPNVDLAMAKLFKKYPDKLVHTVGSSQSYGFVGAFVVKDHWRRPADINLVIKATGQLEQLANNNPSYTFHLPFPAIGKGGLSVNEVLPIIQQLPDNVLVYKG